MKVSEVNEVASVIELSEASGRVAAVSNLPSDHWYSSNWNVRGNNLKPTWRYKETEAVWQQHGDQQLDQLQSPTRAVQRLPWDNYDHFLHDSDQRQRLKHVEKHRAQLTPNVEAIAEIFKN